MDNSTKIVSTLIIIAIVLLASISAYTLMTGNAKNGDSTQGGSINTEITHSDDYCEPDYTDLSPFASFYVTPSIPIVNQPVTFLDASKAGSGTIKNWSWNFGDGQTSIAANPTYVYSTSGEKTVTLTITNTNGKTSTSTRTFTVSETAGYETSFVEFATSPYTIYVSQIITFTEVSLAGSTPSLQWFWDFGDGTTSTDQSPTHVYSTCGENTVTLTVVDGRFVTSSVTHKLTVNEIVEPTADFTFTPSEPFIGNIVTFRCITTVGSGTITHFLWDFGDGQTSTAHHPTHTYTTTGDKIVTLTVTDIFGKTSTATQTINIAST